MRILYLTNIPSPYRVDFFNELGKHCDLTVLFEKSFSHERDYEWHNHYFINFKGIFLKSLLSIRSNVISVEFISYIKKGNFEKIIISGYSTPTGSLAIQYLNFKKIPYIISVDGGLIKYDESSIKIKLKKHLLSNADAWLSTGNVSDDYLLHYGAKKEYIYHYPFTTVFRDDILTSPLSVNEKAKMKEKLGIKNEKIIISVGRFIPSKGIDVLLKAWGNVREGALYIIGGQPTNEYLEIIKERNLKNVYFLDFMDKATLFMYYQSADLFVLPTFTDVWGLVVNEAMANGLPIITTNKCVAGVELIQDNKNGFIVPIKNEQVLAEKINEILNNQEMMNNMALNNLEKAKKYSIENMALVTVDILKNL